MVENLVWNLEILCEFQKEKNALKMQTLKCKCAMIQQIKQMAHHKVTAGFKSLASVFLVAVLSMSPVLGLNL